MVGWVHDDVDGGGVGGWKVCGVGWCVGVGWVVGGFIGWMGVWWCGCWWGGWLEGSCDGGW